MKAEHCPIYFKICDPKQKETCIIFQMRESQKSYGTGGQQPDEFASQEEKDHVLQRFVDYAKTHDCPQAENIDNRT